MAVQKQYIMARPYHQLLTGLLLSLASGTVLAIGIPSNTLIVSSVTVDHELSGVPQVQQVATVQFRVDNKIDLSMGVTNDTVSPSQGNQPITFVIVNEGNTTQGYALAVANSTVADDFNMNNVRLYIETGAVAGFDVTDTLYTTGSGTNAGNLDPNSGVPGADTLTVYLVADVPPTGGGSAPLDAQNARYDLLVTTLNAGTNTVTPGSNTIPWNPNTVQAVFTEGAAGPHASDGNNDGELSATSVYSVNAPAISFVKSAVITDLLGGSNPSDGATITYTLLVSVSGSGTADNVIITDAIPANTTYTNNSLTLNASALSDGADADAGDFNITNSNSITVDLGTLNSVSGNQVITFSVTINP